MENNKFRLKKYSNSFRNWQYLTILYHGFRQSEYYRVRELNRFMQKVSKSRFPKLL